MEKMMMSIKEIAEAMGMGIHQAERLVKSAGFPSIKIGRRYFVPISEFEKWIKNYAYSQVPYKL